MTYKRVLIVIAGILLSLQIAAQELDAEANEESATTAEMARADPDAVMEEIVVEEERIKPFYENFKTIYTANCGATVKRKATAD